VVRQGAFTGAHEVKARALSAAAGPIELYRESRRREQPFRNSIDRYGVDPVGSPRFSLGQAVILDELIEAPDGRKQIHQP
jgi:hypothetical protein